MDQSIFAQNKVFTTTLGGAVLCFLYLTSIHNYLLFHCLLEMFSILVAWVIFWGLTVLFVALPAMRW